MAKHGTDPVLQQLIDAVNKSRQAEVPMTISVRGSVLTGGLVAEETYFAELVDASPLMGALEPSSGLLGKEYAKEVGDASGHFLHFRAPAKGAEGLWRISLDAIDGWVLGAAGNAAAQDEKGPFKGLFAS
jgi:hypothetical protein